MKDEPEIVFQQIPIKEFFKEGVVHQDSMSITRIVIMTRAEAEEIFPSKPETTQPNQKEKLK